MYVYCLVNKKNNTPFYVGITKNPKVRLKQHKTTNYHNHSLFVNSPNDMEMNIICNTGDNQYSLFLAEKIETNFIHFFNTVNYGSNKVYDVKQSFLDNIKNNQLLSLTAKSKEKSKRTISKKRIKKFKKFIQFLEKDPWVDKDKLLEHMGYKTCSGLNRFIKLQTNKTLAVFLEEFREEWCLRHNLTNKKEVDEFNYYCNNFNKLVYRLK